MIPPRGRGSGGYHACDLLVVLKIISNEHTLDSLSLDMYGYCDDGSLGLPLSALLICLFLRKNAGELLHLAGLLKLATMV